MMQSYTELEQAMNSMERISEYLDLPSEHIGVDEAGELSPPLPPPPPSWPSYEGGIIVKDLVVRYAKDLEPVLHGVSFELKVNCEHFFVSFSPLLITVLTHDHHLMESTPHRPGRRLALLDAQGAGNPHLPCRSSALFITMPPLPLLPTNLLRRLLISMFMEHRKEVLLSTESILRRSALKICVRD